MDEWMLLQLRSTSNLLGRLCMEWRLLNGRMDVVAAPKPIQSPTKEGAARAHPLIHSDFHFIGQVIQLPVILHIAVE